MALTRDIKHTIKERIRIDSEYRAVYLKEILTCLQTAEVDVGKSMLHEYIEATIGFEKLSVLINGSQKELDRTLSLDHNTNVQELIQITRQIGEIEATSKTLGSRKFEKSSGIER